MQKLFTAVARMLAVGVLMPLADSAAAQQSYPSKPIRFIVANPPGGATDLTARLIGQKLTESWGHTVVIDNRAGASGVIGQEILAKAAPDGYTISLASTPFSMTPSMFSKLSYDPVKDFAPVTQVSSAPYILVVNPSLSVQSVKELIALAKSKPGQLSYASVGIGGGPHLGMELFKTITGTDMMHVPYKGGAPAVNDLIGGHVQLMLDVISSSMPHVKTGKIRALAVSSAKRLLVAPNLPTIAESGLPGFELISWQGVLAPAKTPKEIIIRLNAEIVKIMHMRDVKDRLSSLGVEPLGTTTDQFAAFLNAEIVKWAKVVKDSGTRAD